MVTLLNNSQNSFGAIDIFEQGSQYMNTAVKPVKKSR